MAELRGSGELPEQRPPPAARFRFQRTLNDPHAYYSRSAANPDVVVPQRRRTIGDVRFSARIAARGAAELSVKL